jgi:hypothetical protein
VVIEAVAIALLGVLVFGLLRTQTRRTAAVPGRAPASNTGPAPQPLRCVGAPAPAVAGVDPRGAPVTVAVGPGADPVLLAFLTEGCRECAMWWSALGSARRALLGPSVAVVTPSPSTERPEAVRRVAPAGLPVVMSSDTWEAYGVSAASTFVLVEGGQVRAGGRAYTWDELAAVMAAAGDPGGIPTGP